MRPCHEPRSMSGAAAIVGMLLLAWASVGLGDLECPSVCKCKWVSGKQAALCSDSSISEVPRGLDADTQLLNVSSSSLSKLGDGAFQAAGLLNLQRIYIRGTGLRDLAPGAFKGLVLLVEVDLGDNQLVELHPDTFLGCVRLRSAVVSGNPLSRLRSEQFPELLHLRFLELRECHLVHIHPDAFVHLAALEGLDLRGNRLATLAAATFAPLQRLASLALDNNPWRCDCRLRALRDWYLSSRLAQAPLSCKEPHPLRGLRWRDAPSRSFACAPKVLAVASGSLRAQQGANVTIPCRVEGDPEPQVVWLFAGNDSLPATALVEAEEGLLSKWVNVTVVNASEADAGEYSCVAENVGGRAGKTVVLMMAEATSQATSHPAQRAIPLPWMAVAAGAAVLAAALCLLLGAVACSRTRKQRARHRATGHLCDHDKKLLEASVSTSEPMSNAQSMETIDPSPEMAFPPPPPEFSAGVLPCGSYGNIFISVSVSQEPAHYPDLLDIPRRPSDPLPEPVYREMVTLPRRRLTPINICIDAYDNMGPRVTAAGNSILSPLMEIPEESSEPPSPPRCLATAESSSL